MELQKIKPRRAVCFTQQADNYSITTGQTQRGMIPTNKNYFVYPDCINGRKNFNRLTGIITPKYPLVINPIVWMVDVLKKNQ